MGCYQFKIYYACLMVTTRDDLVVITQKNIINSQNILIPKKSKHTKRQQDKKQGTMDQPKNKNEEKN